MNALSLIAIGGSLAALAAAPTHAKSPAPLPAEARVVSDDSDNAQRLQLRRLWGANSNCSREKAPDYYPQRHSQGCFDPKIAEAGFSIADFAAVPKTDK